MAPDLAAAGELISQAKLTSAVPAGILPELT